MRTNFEAGTKAVRLAVFALAVVWGQGLLASSVVHVGTCEVSPNPISTIQEGVNAAPPGGMVHVCPGTYPEQVTINEPLTITGIQVGTSDAVVILPPVGGLSANTSTISPITLAPSFPHYFQILITATAGNVNLNNLTVDGSGNNLLSACSFASPVEITGIYYQGASGTVNNVALRNQFVDPSGACGSGEGIFVDSSIGTAGSPLNINVTIQQSSIRAYQVLGISESGFGVAVTIRGNTMGPGLDTPNFAENDIQLVGATGSLIGNSLVGDGGQFSSCLLGFASHGLQIVGNTVGNCGTGIGLNSVDGVGNANNGNITGNVVFSSSGTNLAIQDAGIELCSSNNQVQGNEINGSSAVAIYTDTCGNATFGTTGNIIKSNHINDACAGVLLNTAGNSVSSNQFQNVFETVANGNHCP